MAYDFQQYWNIDVISFFLGDRGWTEFYPFVVGLPSHSRVKSAMAMDKNIAAHEAAQVPDNELQRILDQRAGGGKNDKKIPLQDYTLEIETINKVVDAVNALRVTVAKALGSKDDFKPTARPTTAFDEALEERVKAFEKRDNEKTLSLFGF